ncbi:MAG: phosphoadenylyl-sulfate reductase [Candidatus Omnitrophica bacterium]|nr:phosphoadenylyl-sulfate reductase [Candidatus Omnitrophota bacterium]
MNRNEISAQAVLLEPRGPEEVISWAANSFGVVNVALATSFGAEDQVLTDMISKAGQGIGIFTLDTLRLPPETHEVMAATIDRYGVMIDVLRPDPEAVKNMVDQHGVDLFYKSVELRKQCCAVRKVVPLRKKLSTLKAWICGLRRDQALTRAGVGKVEWDEANGLVKINPLAGWSEQDVWAYIRKNKVPYNKLHDQGYPSIGCAPCTRAVKAGEDVRAGRWWWENPEHKECGLHTRRKV